MTQGWGRREKKEGRKEGRMEGKKMNKTVKSPGVSVGEERGGEEIFLGRHSRAETIRTDTKMHLRKWRERWQTDLCAVSDGNHINGKQPCHV